MARIIFNYNGGFQGFKKLLGEINRDINILDNNVNNDEDIKLCNNVLGRLNTANYVANMIINGEYSNPNIGIAERDWILNNQNNINDEITRITELREEAIWNLRFTLGEFGKGFLHGLSSPFVAVGKAFWEPRKTISGIYNFISDPIKGLIEVKDNMIDNINNYPARTLGDISGGLVFTGVASGVATYSDKLSKAGQATLLSENLAIQSAQISAEGIKQITIKSSSYVSNAGNIVKAAPIAQAAVELNCCSYIPISQINQIAQAAAKTAPIVQAAAKTVPIAQVAAKAAPLAKATIPAALLTKTAEITIPPVKDNIPAAHFAQDVNEEDKLTEEEIYARNQALEKLYKLTAKDKLLRDVFCVNGSFAQGPIPALLLTESDKDREELNKLIGEDKLLRDVFSMK